MNNEQRRAMWAKKKYSPIDSKFPDYYSKLNVKAQQGDKKATRLISKINQSEGWTQEDIDEQEAFQKMIRGN